jgi:hypothetical protein
MFKASRHMLIALAAIAAVSAPSCAYGMVIGEAGPVSAPATSASANPTPPQQAQLGAYQRAVAKRLESTPGGLVGAVVPPRSAASQAGVSASNSFQWADAAIGAAALLVLIGVGSSTAVAVRRRAHHRLAS